MRKGFTLIELLAVIIILAVVALITTPIVLDIVEDSKKSAAKSQTAMVLDSAKLYYTEEYFKLDTSFEGYECSISNKVGCDELSLEGDKPDSVIISIDKNGRVNGKVVVGKYINYICNNKVTEEETSDCNFIDYTLIYDITTDGVITGFKTNTQTSFLNIIPVVNAEELTAEVQSYLETKEITIPEYVGDIEVTGIADNAFSSHDIETITILPIRKLNIGTNAFPTTLTKLRVSSCLETSYSAYSDILELIERDCETTEQKKIICKRADVNTLHTETCSTYSGEGCLSNGYTNGATITYGNIETTDELLSGDAFDCDVDGDGNYGECDETTGKCSERFYYVSDLYDTTTKDFNEAYAVLIYYSNIRDGETINSKGNSVYYYATAVNNKGPVAAVKELPTIENWSNVNLLNSIRSITNENAGTKTTAGTLPKSFSYDGYAARLLTYQEFNVALNNGSTINYLLENTQYNSRDLLRGYWLETAYQSSMNSAWGVDGSGKTIEAWATTSEALGVRPVIEVAKENIEY